MIKKRCLALLVGLVFTASLVLLAAPAARAAFNRDYIISDTSFDNSSALNPSQVDALLNAKNSCISPNSGFSAIEPIGYSPSGGYQYGGNVSAGTVIVHAAQAYDLNPAVLLVTLQKEQSLVTSTSCTTNTISKAMGYACPDSGGSYSYSGLNLYTRHGTTFTTANGICVNSAAKAGFSQQVIRAAWLLKFSQQRSLGNTGWAIVRGNWNNSDDLSSCYGGAMTAGYRKRCASDPAPVYYDGYTTIDGVSTFMGTGATAALYRYTPHFHGNQNFYNIFVSWFGDPNSSCYGVSNVAGARTGAKIIPYRYNGHLPTSLALIIQNNTGSTCTEAHVLRSGYQSWLTNMVTGMKANNPDGGTIIPMRLNGSYQDGLVYLTYSGGGGVTEVHQFSPNLRIFPGYYDVPTNLGGVTATSGSFVAGDFLGRGYDQLVYVLYSGGGGMAEIHMFDPTLRRAIGVYDVPTNLSGVSANSGTFVAGDFLGRGYDQLVYVLYSGGNGMAEIHMFDPTLRSAIGVYDVPTNLGGVTATSGSFVAGDFLGRGYDQLTYVLNNGGSGRVESHMFTPDLRSGIGFQDIITSIGGFDPTL